MTAPTAAFANRVGIGARVRAGSGSGLGRRRSVGAVDLVGACIAGVSTVGGFDVFGIRLNRFRGGCGGFSVGGSRRAARRFLGAFGAPALAPLLDVGGRNR